MPTLARYYALMSERKFHEAACEACTQAGVLVKNLNSGSVRPRAGEEGLKNALSETVERHLHFARLAVNTAIADSEQDELRAIKRDRELVDTLDDARGTLRNRIEDAIQTLPG